MSSDLKAYKSHDPERIAQGGVLVKGTQLKYRLQDTSNKYHGQLFVSVVESVDAVRDEITLVTGKKVETFPASSLDILTRKNVSPSDVTSGTHFPQKKRKLVAKDPVSNERGGKHRRRGRRSHILIARATSGSAECHRTDVLGFQPPISSVPLDPDLNVGSDFCVPHAFAVAVSQLLDGTSNDVFVDSLSKKTWGCCTEYANAIDLRVISSWAHITIPEFAQYLQSNPGRNMLYWHNAPGDGSYDQIDRAELIEEPFARPDSWSALHLTSKLIESAAVFLVQISEGHCVCVDTRAGQPPLIYDTSGRYTHAIPLSAYNLGVCGWRGSWLTTHDGTVREVRLFLKSGAEIPRARNANQRRINRRYLPIQTPL